MLLIPFNVCLTKRLIEKTFIDLEKRKTVILTLVRSCLPELINPLYLGIETRLGILEEDFENKRCSLSCFTSTQIKNDLSSAVTFR